MRLLFTLFLVLNIYTPISGLSQERTLTLSLKGSTNLETAIIDSISYNTSFTDLNSLKDAATTTTSALINKGYLDAQLDSLIQKDAATYNGTIKTGPFYKYLTIKIPQGEELLDFIQQAGIDIKDGVITVETAYAKALLEELTNIAANNGRPFASFRLSKIRKINNNRITATLLFTSQSKKRRIDRIIVKGYEKFPASFLSRYAQVKKGALFDQEKLLKQNSAIDALPFAKSIKEPEVLFREDSTTVYFYAEQIKSNRFDGFIGFATDEQTNNLRLDGYIDLQLTNNLHYGETLLLNYKSDGGDQSQLNVRVNLPYILKTPFELEAKLALFRKDSTFSITSQEANLSYKLSPVLSAGVGYQSTKSENLQEMGTIAETSADYTASKFLINGDYRITQNNYFFPNKATFSVQGSLGNRSTTIKERQVGLHINASTIINLNESNSVYLQNNTRSLWSDNFVTNELYRFGGITSIRGFQENSIFANFVSTLNTEYRYIFNQTLYVHSVIDAAYFENRINNERLTLFSFGAGAGIRTKAGVLRIIFANGKNENQNFDFNNTKLHFQLAVRF